VRKVLRYHVTQCDKGGIQIKVSEQSHRCSEFGLEGNKFYATNGVILASTDFPVLVVPSLILCVRGADLSCDSHSIDVPFDMASSVFEAVEQYNGFDFPAIAREVPCTVKGDIVEIKGVRYRLASIDVEEKFARKKSFWNKWTQDQD
jgi:hypothetical protein